MYQAILPPMLTFSAFVEIIYLKGKSSLLSFTTLRANTLMETFNWAYDEIIMIKVNYSLDFSVLIWISKVSSPKNVSSNMIQRHHYQISFFTDKVNYLQWRRTRWWHWCHGTTCFFGLEVSKSLKILETHDFNAINHYSNR